MAQVFQSYLTASELARLLNVHINTVRRWSDRGLLKANRIGPRGDRRFSRESIAHFLAQTESTNGTVEKEKVPAEPVGVR
jgi:excisionase family DNA binding protein